ncbi:rRNA maturation RNase YbeY [Candidatus Omnitrophota bacterium]
MKVDIRDLQAKVKIDTKKIVQRAEFILNKMGEDRGELSLLFVADSYIRRLNSKYRNVDSRTDVLAFSMREGYGLPEESPILGDVVISTETAKRAAGKRRVSVQSEIELYLVHGILHLLGYKDERSSDRKKMKAKEKELLESM